MVQIKCDINIGKKAFVLIILGFVLILATGFVISNFGGIINPESYPAPNPGHTARDSWIHVDGDIMTLQDAIENDYILSISPGGGISDVNGSLEVAEWVSMGHGGLWKTCPCDVNGNNCPDECVVECPDGKRILGGGCSINGGTGQILENFPLDNYHWKCIGDNVGMTAHAICAKMTHSVLAETF